MSRALASGAPRMLGRHGGSGGRWFDEQYRALNQRLGPFDAVLRFYAGATSVLWVEFRRNTLALEEAERLRQDGRGRRPSASAVARLKKRQGLSWQSYDASLRRLEELAKTRTGQHDPLADVHRAVEAANR